MNGLKIGAIIVLILAVLIYSYAIYHQGENAKAFIYLSVAFMAMAAIMMMVAKSSSIRVSDGIDFVIVMLASTLTASGAYEGTGLFHNVLTGGIAVLAVVKMAFVN